MPASVGNLANSSQGSWLAKRPPAQQISFWDGFFSSSTWVGLGLRERTGQKEGKGQGPVSDGRNRSREDFGHLEKSPPSVDCVFILD